MARTPNDFWSRVDIKDPSECWLFRSRSRQPYAQILYQGKIVRVHRLAFVLSGETLLPGQVVMHSCDVPHCCNPWHLSAGTPAENSADMWAKGRAFTLRGPDSPKAKLTAEQVRMIRRSPRGWRNAHDLGQQMGVGYRAIYRVWRGDTYRSVC